MELTDQRFNYLLHSRNTLRNLFEQAAQQRSGFIEKYANACIWLVFKPKVHSKKYIQKVLDLLSSECIPENHEGDVLNSAILSEEGQNVLAGWGDKLESLEVHRENTWDHQIPCFWTAKAEPVDVGRVLDRIREKFGKCYELKLFNQAELLGYFNSHPPPALHRWKDDVHAFVQKHLEHSSFARVWIFDAKEKSLLYVYPDL